MGELLNVTSILIASKSDYAALGAIYWQSPLAERALPPRDAFEAALGFHLPRTWTTALPLYDICIIKLVISWQVAQRSDRAFIAFHKSILRYSFCLKRTHNKGNKAYRMKSKLNAEVENLLSLGNKFLNEDLIQCLIYLISKFHSFHHGNKSYARIYYCTNAIIHCFHSFNWV